jgi:hypothetical protein
MGKTIAAVIIAVAVLPRHWKGPVAVLLMLWWLFGNGGVLSAAIFRAGLPRCLPVSDAVPRGPAAGRP